MAKSAGTFDYARHGAKARYTELAQEMRNIQTDFPGIERDIRASNTTSSSPEKASSKGTRKRRHYTAAQRAAISARMVKMHAERKKAKLAGARKRKMPKRKQTATAADE